MATLRRFIRYLQQFEPQTEMPEASIFGPEPGRVAPHIYREQEIVDLLAATRKLGPCGSFRPATFETLFGLMASTGLRVSEAPHLRDADVDLKLAVRRLMRWYREGTDIDQMILALSTYLGHTKISHTYWYLSAVPELMALAGGKFERFVDLAGADDE
jgi:integrase